MLDYRKVTEFFLNNDLANDEKDSELFLEYMKASDSFFEDKVVRFEREFRTHEETRKWALSILEGKRCVGVDGSQIYHDPHINLPIALVQASFFSNWHLKTGKFEKDSVVDVINLNRFNEETKKFSSLIDDEFVDFKRTELEVNLLKKLIANEDGTFFVDNGLSPEFSIADIYSARYKLMFGELLRVSEEHGKVVLGYIAKPHSKHLTKQIAHLNGLERMGFVTDTVLLDEKLRWGDYTKVEKLNEKVWFSYIRVGDDIARVEIPTFVVERKMVDETMMMVLAESIVGLGYPYIIEAAHNTVVIKASERMMFYEIALKNLKGNIFSKKAMKKIVARR